MTTIVHVERPCVLPAYSIPGVLPRSRGRRLLDELERARFWRERRRADEDVALCASLGALPGGSFAGLGPFWAAAFSPAKVQGNLRFGYAEKASDASSYPDRTGNGHDFVQGTPSERPTFSATGLNGRPALVFDGVDDRISCITAFAHTLMGGTNAASTQILVLQVITDDVISSFFSCYRSNTALPRWAIKQHQVGAGVWYIFKRDDANSANPEPTGGFVGNDPHILIVVTESDGGLRVYDNGELVELNRDDVVTGALTLDQAQFGADRTAAFGNFALAADAFYTRAVTDTERLYLERGYAARYGLTLSS